MYGPHFPDGFFETLLILAGIGILALVGSGLAGIVWLIMHVRFA